MARGCAMASVTACLVMALNTTRSMVCDLSAFFSRSTCSTCQDIVESLLRLGIDLPEHAKIMVRIDRTALGGQVAHVTERRQDFVARAQILIDRLRLGGRFHQYQIHANPMILRLFSLLDA